MSIITRFAFALQFVLIVLTLPVTVSCTACTNSCWNQALARYGCDPSSAGFMSCVCNDVYGTGTFQACNQVCYDEGEYGGSPYEEKCMASGDDNGDGSAGRKRSLSTALS